MTMHPGKCLSRPAVLQTVPKKGEDPQQDLQDKMLMKVATR